MTPCDKCGCSFLPLVYIGTSYHSTNSEDLVPMVCEECRNEWIYLFQKSTFRKRAPKIVNNQWLDCFIFWFCDGSKIEIEEPEVVIFT